MTQLRFVLVQPRYPANIGAAARAIKTMGFDQLWLVAPHRFPDPEATRLATEAADVLDAARVVDDLDEALADAQLVLATSARPRAADWPDLRVDQAARRAADVDGTVAVLFGPEPSGLTSEAIYRSQFQVWIDTDPACRSLNLAQAVQLVAHEFRSALRETSAQSAGPPLADHEQLEHLFRQVQKAVVTLDFPNRDPDHLMLRFRRIFNRAALSDREARLLHGLFARVEQRCRR